MEFESTGNGFGVIKNPYSSAARFFRIAIPRNERRAIARFLLHPRKVGEPLVYKMGNQKPAGSFLNMIFELPDRQFPWRFFAWGKI